MQKDVMQEREKALVIRSDLLVAKVLKFLIKSGFFCALLHVVFACIAHGENKGLFSEKITKKSLTFCIQFGLIPFSDCKQEV